MVVPNGVKNTGTVIHACSGPVLVAVYASYVDETGIDYVVTYSKGNVNNLSGQCWTVLSAIAYAEDRQGDRFTNAYAARRAGWVNILECQIAGVR